MQNNSLPIMSKTIEYFRKQEDSQGHYGNTSFLLDNLSQWSDSIEKDDEFSIKQDLFSVISCLVPFNWLDNRGKAASISQFSDNEFFLPSYFDRISKLSSRMIKNIISKHINSIK